MLMQLLLTQSNVQLITWHTFNIVVYSSHSDHVHATRCQAGAGCAADTSGVFRVLSFLASV